MDSIILECYDQKAKAWYEVEIIEIEEIDMDTISILFPRKPGAKSEVIELDLIDCKLGEGSKGYRLKW